MSVPNEPCQHSRVSSLSVGGDVVDQGCIACHAHRTAMWSRGIVCIPVADGVLLQGLDELSSIHTSWNLGAPVVHLAYQGRAIVDD